LTLKTPKSYLFFSYFFEAETTIYLLLWKESFSSDGQQYQTKRTNTSHWKQKDHGKTYYVGNPGPCLEQLQNCGKVKPVLKTI